MKKIVMNTMLAAALCFGFAACDSGQKATNETETAVSDAETAASTDANTSEKDPMERAEDANEDRMENNNAMTGSNSDDKEDDAEFMMKAAASGMFELQASELALQKASSKSVKDFARKMKEDHTKANKELKALAAKKNITLPTSLDKDHQDKLEDLRKESGADFDSEYMQAMHKAHEKDVELFEEASKEDDADADIKAFAAKTLPTLQSHHQMAESKKEMAKEMDMDTIGIPKSKRNNQ
jgi:putative membrane protein